HVEDDWDRSAVSLDDKRRFPKDGYDCHPTADQIGKQFRQSRVFVIRGPQLDRYIVSLDVPDLAEPFAKSREKRFGRPAARVEIPHDRHRRLLRPRHHRPRRRTPKDRNELPPFHSMTSSARTRTACGTSRPSAFAVFLLSTNSYF